MFRVNAKTRTTTALAFDGNRVRLDHPQFLAECPEDRVPYVMPSPEGGYLIFAEYGDPCPSEHKPAGSCCDGCGTGGPCENEKKNKPKCHSSKVKMEQKEAERLIRFEIVKYSGYDSDGLTLLITERGVEGTVKHDWPAGSLVMQTMTGTELKDVLTKIQAIKDFLDKLGCIAAVPTAMDGACGVYNIGDWYCFGGKWYRRKNSNGCDGAPGENWGCGMQFEDVLNFVCDGVNSPALTVKSNAFGQAGVQCSEFNVSSASSIVSEGTNKEYFYSTDAVNWTSLGDGTPLCGDDSVTLSANLMPGGGWVKVVMTDRNGRKTVTIERVDACCAPNVLIDEMTKSSSGGVCVAVNSNNDSRVVYQGRNGTVIEGDGAFAFGNQNGAYVHARYCNSFNCNALLEVFGVVHGKLNASSIEGGATFIHAITEELNIRPLMGFGAGNSPAPSNWSWINVIDNQDSSVSAGGYVYDPILPNAYETAETGSIYFQKILTPGQCIDLYAQWWAVLNGKAVTSILHPAMKLYAKLTKNVGVL